jgi:uncharacterized protein (TIGR02246 family)
MRNKAGTGFAGKVLRTTTALLLGVALLLAGASPAAAQQKDKKKKKDASAQDASKPIVQLPDEAQIDYLISEMMGAWQLGDVERLHKTYAEDVSVVNGNWAPPVIGWTNYLALYQQQRARIQQVRMDRANTYIRVLGTFAYASYQWDFSAVVDGQASSAQGQTTLVLEKRNDRWMIVHNHTSLVQTAPPPAPANTPAAPPQPNKPA